MELMVIIHPYYHYHHHCYDIIGLGDWSIWSDEILMPETVVVERVSKENEIENNENESHSPPSTTATSRAHAVV